jgi:hypothetical protein
MPAKTKIQLPKPYLIQTILSRIFDPPVVIVFLTVIAVWLSGLSHRGFLFFALLLPVMLGLPLAFFVWRLHTHQVTNWDITNRKERIIPLLAFIVFLFVDLLIISIMQNSFLLHVFILYFFWVVGFFILTLIFKISGHSGMTTLAVGLLLHWFGWSMWPVIAAIPVICWARVTRRDHTLFQVVAGVIYSLVILRLWGIVVL